MAMTEQEMFALARAKSASRLRMEDGGKFGGGIGLSRQQVAPGVSVPGIETVSGEEIERRGAILPLGRTESGDLVITLPQALLGPLQTAAGILSGEKTEITGEELRDIALLAAGPSAASGTGRAIARTRGVGAVSPVTRAAERQGVDLPRGVVGETAVTRTATRLTGAIPVGGTPLQQAAKTALDQLESAATRVQEQTGRGSMVAASDVVEAGIQRFAGKDGVLAQRVNEKYARVDGLVDNVVAAVPSRTAVVITELQGKPLGDSTVLRRVADVVNNPGGLNYENTKLLRTRIGEMLGSPGLLPEDTSTAGLKQVYKALTEDLRAIIQTAGGNKAVKAWEFANRSAAKTRDIQEKLSKVVRGDNEGAIFSRLEGMAGMTGRADIRGLAQVRAAVGKEDWPEVASAFIQKFSRGTGGEFRPQTFVNQWARMSSEAKRIIFDKKTADAIDDIVAISKEAADLQKVAEPSQFGAIIGVLGLGGISQVVALVTDIAAIGTFTGAAAASRVIANILAKPQGAVALKNFERAKAAFVGRPNRVTAQTFRQRALALTRIVSVEEGLESLREDEVLRALTSFNTGG